MFTVNYLFKSAVSEPGARGQEGRRVTAIAQLDSPDSQRAASFRRASADLQALKRCISG
jgi:hypothetical protein